MRKKLLILVIIGFLMLQTKQNQDSTNDQQEDEFLQKNIIKNDLDKHNIQKQQYFNSLQVSFGNNLYPDVISEGIVSQNYSTTPKHTVGYMTSLVHLTIWSSQPELTFDSNLRIEILNNTNISYIKLRSSLDMLSEFIQEKQNKQLQNDNKNITICGQKNQQERLYLLFFCQNNGTILVKGTIQSNNSQQRQFYFNKNCIVGNKNQYVYFNAAFKKNHLDDPQMQINMEEFYQENKFVVNQQQNELYLLFQTKFGHQLFLNPQLLPNTSNISVDLRGPGTHGGILSKEHNLVDNQHESKLLVILNFVCKADLVAEMLFQAQLTPFKSLKFQFLKICNTSKIENHNEKQISNVINEISIGQQDLKFDVVKNGLTQQLYSWDQEKYPKGENLQVVNNDEDATLYIINSTYPYKINDVQFSYNQHILNPIVEGLKEKQFNQMNLKQFIIVYQCIEEGQSILTTTIKFENSQRLEFSVLKNCQKKILQNEVEEEPSFLLYLMFGFWSFFMFYFIFKYFGKFLKNGPTNDIQMQAIQNKYSGINDIPRPNMI